MLAPASSALQVKGLAWFVTAEDDFSSCPASVVRRGSCRNLPAESVQKLGTVTPTKTIPLAKPRARRFRREDARIDIVDSHPARPGLGDFDRVLRKRPCQVDRINLCRCPGMVSAGAPHDHAAETELYGLRLIGRLGCTGFGRHRSAVFEVEIITRRRGRRGRRSGHRRRRPCGGNLPH